MLFFPKVAIFDNYAFHMFQGVWFGRLYCKQKLQFIKKAKLRPIGMWIM